MPPLELGLLGTNIGKSRSPLLHELAGRLCGLETYYRPFDLAGREDEFEAVFADCRAKGLRGVNVTHPFKSRAVALVEVPDPAVRRIGSINTVRFPDATDHDVQPRGYNTDFSGFIAAYRNRFGQQPPGRVALIGAGGVGKAIAFALLELGAAEIRVADSNRPTAEALASNLEAGGAKAVRTTDSAQDAAMDANGVINATPLGMWGYPGSPVPPYVFGRQRWAFDAVYTPVDTEFLTAAQRYGLQTMSGYDLFFYQGLHAFEIFAGTAPAEDQLFEALAQAA